MGKGIASKRPFRRFGGIVPKKQVAYFTKKLNYAGMRVDARVWLGERLLLSFLMGVVSLALYLAIHNPVASPMTAIIGASLLSYGVIATIMMSYLELYFKIADRTSRVEKILPDFLLLTVSNLRAGMTPYSAFVQASKPEFGDLYEEVRLSTAKAGGTASLVDALSEISLYFDSEILRRTVKLFAKGIRSGGQLAKLLRNSAEEVQRIQDLRAELTSATRTYAIFLGFILVVVMPFLLSVSTQFVTAFLELQPDDADLELEGAAELPSFSGLILITPEEMMMISVVTLVITSLLVSFLLGIINKGRAIYGLKYFPIFAVASTVLFFIAKEFISGMFSVFV
jgi:pilus assembly protein TadC